MHKLLRGLTVACLTATAMLSHAQTAGYTTVTASALKMSGNKITTGTATFTPVNLLGQPIPFADGSGAQNGPQSFECAIAAGAITGMLQEDGTFSGTCAIPDSLLTTPADLLYQVEITDTSKGLSTSGFSYKLFTVPNITGSTWALDHYGPPAQTTNVAPLQAGIGSTLPTSCTSPSVFTLTPSGAFYTCVAGTFVPVSSASASSSSVSTTSATCGSTYALAFNSLGDATYDVTLTANCAFTLIAPSNTSTYRKITLIVRPAGFQATLPASSSALVWSGGSVPLPSTSSYTVITFGSTGTAPVFGGI